MKLKYVFSSLGILICLSVFADGVKPAKVGEQSPDFQFADKNGKMYSLKDFKGQYVFIDIWATHCFPCKEEIPYLEEIQEKLKKKNIAFIGIATDLDKDEWIKFIEEKALKGTQRGKNHQFKYASSIKSPMYENTQIIKEIRSITNR